MSRREAAGGCAVAGAAAGHGAAAGPHATGHGAAAGPAAVKIVILGSTGSIGKQALEVAAAHPGKLEVVGLAAHSNAALLAEQARRTGARRLALGSEQAAAAKAPGDLPGKAILECGGEAVAALAELEEADVVLNALVGAAGLRASFAALAAGKTLALANKESLVVGGELLMPMAGQGQLLPVDSEHSAIFQCLLGEKPSEVEALWVTASGGPFRGWQRESLKGVTPSMALAHPTWSMGRKISIDSATLMNKGLEVIEAHHLFNMPYDKIKVAVHPQSCIHSMVAFRDGSVKAHLGVTDMRIPIQFAFSFPERWSASWAKPAEPPASRPAAAVDFTTLADLTFAAADAETFGCLRLAFTAGLEGGTMPAVLNAANEVAVAAFLGGEVGFLGIEAAVAAVMASHAAQKVVSLEQLESVDAWARAEALRAIRAMARESEQ